MGLVPATISGAQTTAPATPPKSVFDDRLVEVDISIPVPAGQSGPAQTFTFNNSKGNNIGIFAAGTLFGSAAQNQCDIRIFNLSAATRNLILTKTSPLFQNDNNRLQVSVQLKAGRKSYGTFLLFTGNVISGNVSQPPDVGISLRSLTNNYFNGTLLGITEPANTLLSTISANIANQFQPALSLNFLATDKQINNFSYSGSLGNLVTELEVMGNVQAWVQNGVLTVINAGSTIPGAPVKVNLTTGMIGIPQTTEQGVLFTCLLNPAIQIGSAVEINSIENPAVNGTYKVFKINYELATRENPFWYIVECSNRGYLQGSLP